MRYVAPYIRNSILDFGSDTGFKVRHHAQILLCLLRRYDLRALFHHQRNIPALRHKSTAIGADNHLSIDFSRLIVDHSKRIRLQAFGSLCEFRYLPLRERLAAADFSENPVYTADHAVDRTADRGNDGICHAGHRALQGIFQISETTKDIITDRSERPRCTTFQVRPGIFQAAANLRPGGSRISVQVCPLLSHCTADILEF